MLFVSILTAKQNLPVEQSQEGLQRRLQWQPPAGVKIVAEYWLQGAPGRVIAISEADSLAGIFQVNLQWGDLFDIEVIPAMTAEEGLKLAAQAAQQGTAVPAGLRQ